MIGAIKPSIGWLGYAVIRRSSPTTIAFTLLLFGAIAVYLVQRSRESLTLQFMTPATGSSPFIILPPPSSSSLNSFDACAVESAILPLALSLTPPTSKGLVHLYLWYSNVGPNDVWVKYLSQIKGLRISFLNLVKSLRTTPIEGMLQSGGWGGRPDWAIWLASGGSMLWRSGGILMQNGVILTRPLEINAFGNNTGLFMLRGNNVIPTVIGVPPHHPVTESILDKVQNFNYNLYDSYLYSGKKAKSGIERLLTHAVSDVCEVDNLQVGKCQGFRTTKSNLVYDLSLDKPSSLEEESAYFLRYIGDPEVLKYDLVRTRRFFRQHGLIKYCPNVYKFLNNEVRITL